MPELEAAGLLARADRAALAAYCQAWARWVEAEQKIQSSGPVLKGQHGLYLAELLLSKGYDVHGLIRGQNNPRRDLVADLVPDVRLHAGDLTDMSSLIRALRESEPDEVYNLGAISYVAYSWENAALTTDVTGKGVLNLLEAVRLHASGLRIPATT